MIDIKTMVAEHVANSNNGLPAGEGFVDYISDFGSELANAWRKLVGQATYGVVVAPLGPDNALKRLNKLGLLDSRKLSMVTPYEFEKRASDVYKVIHTQLEQLVDIEKRLYRPLVQQFGKLVTTPDAYSKAWIDENIKFVDTDKMQKELSKLFKRGNKKGGVSEQVDFQDLYDDPSDFNTCSTIQLRLKDTGNLINFVTLKSSEEKLVKLINSFVEEYDNNDDLKMKDHVVKRLVTVTTALGRETEYLVLLLHYANIFIAAHNENIKTIEDL